MCYSLSSVERIRGKIFIDLAMEEIQKAFDKKIKSRIGQRKTAKINLKCLKNSSKNTKFIHKCGMGEVADLLQDGNWKDLTGENVELINDVVGGNVDVNDLYLQAENQAHERVFNF